MDYKNKEGIKDMIRKQNSVDAPGCKRFSASISFAGRMTAFLAILMLASLPRGAQAQADCSTPAGQLALMVAKVVVGDPVDVDTTHSSSLTITFASELFKIPQNATSNSSCDALVSLAIYSSTTSSKLSGLPNLAATNDSFIIPLGVVKTACSKTRSGNTLNCGATLARTSGVVQGATVFYRVGKRITKEGDIDPYVWSSTFSFVVTAPPNQPPTANAGADKTITLPTNTTTITGSGTDPESGPITFSWAKKTGPTAGGGAIASPTAATTNITGLLQGSYTFELTVRDNAAATAKDTMKITVNAAPTPTPAPKPDLMVFMPVFFTSAGDSFVASETGDFGLCSTTGSPTPKITTIPNLIVRVSNAGLAATTGACTLQFNHGSNTNLANQTFTVPILQPGASQDFTITRTERRVCATLNHAICVRCGDGIQGVPRWNDCGISATVDSTSVIAEEIENNNTVSINCP